MILSAVKQSEVSAWGTDYKSGQWVQCFGASVYQLRDPRGPTYAKKKKNLQHNFLYLCCDFLPFGHYISLLRPQGTSKKDWCPRVLQDNICHNKSSSSAVYETEEKLTGTQMNNRADIQVVVDNNSSERTLSTFYLYLSFNLTYKSIMEWYLYLPESLQHLCRLIVFPLLCHQHHLLYQPDAPLVGRRSPTAPQFVSWPQHYRSKDVSSLFRGGPFPSCALRARSCLLYSGLRLLRSHVWL